MPSSVWRWGRLLSFSVSCVNALRHAIGTLADSLRTTDQQAAKGNVSEGESKEGAVQNAAKMAFKMYLKSQMSGGSGGSSGLMGMASKFM